VLRHLFFSVLSVTSSGEQQMLVWITARWRHCFWPYLSFQVYAVLFRCCRLQRVGVVPHRRRMRVWTSAEQRWTTTSAGHTGRPVTWQRWYVVTTVWPVVRMLQF